MNILYVIHDFLPRHPAGSEQYCNSLAREVAAQGGRAAIFATELIAAKPSYELIAGEYEGLPVYTMVFNHDWDSFEAQYRNPHAEQIFQKVLDEVKPDLVHFHHLLYHSFGYLEVLAARGIPTVFTLHDYFLLCPHLRGGQRFGPDGKICELPDDARCADCLKLAHPLVFDSPAPTNFVKVLGMFSRRLAAAWQARNLERHIAAASAIRPADENGEAAVADRRRAAGEVFAKVDKFIAPSRHMLRRFTEAGLPSEKIIHSDNGFPRFEAIREPRRDGFTVGFIGTIVEHKGVHVLVDAMNELRERTDIKCEIWGNKRTFPDYFSELKKQSRENPRIEFKGAFEHTRVNEVLARFDVLCVPSIWEENSPLTIHEAIMANVPVITSDIGGSPELVEGERGGITFRSGDARTLTEAVTRLVDNPELLKELGSNALEVKTIEDDAARHLELYAELIRNGSA